MPRDLRESTQKDVLYPDELPGETLQVCPDRLDGEIVTWEAGEPGERTPDYDDLPDGADFHDWLPVVHPDHGTAWACAPRALREALLGLDLEPGDFFQVTDHYRGDDEHDPHEFGVIEVGPDGGPLHGDG